MDAATQSTQSLIERPNHSTYVQSAYTKTPSCLVRCASKPEALTFQMKLGGRPLWFAQKKCSCNHCTSTRTQGLGCKRVIPQTKLIVEDAKQSTLTIRKELSCSLETWHQDDNSYTVIHWGEVRRIHQSLYTSITWSFWKLSIWWLDMLVV